MSPDTVADAAADRVLLEVGGPPACNNAHPVTDMPKGGNDRSVGEKRRCELDPRPPNGPSTGPLQAERPV